MLILLSSLLWTLASPLYWLITNLVYYYIIYLLTVIAWRCYQLRWCARKSNLLPVNANQAIFITGATSGIGLAVAKYLYKLGYSLIVGYYDQHEPGYEELKTLANKSKQQKIIFIPINVRNLNDIENARNQIELSLAQNKPLYLHALINNAGLGSLVPFMMMNKEDILAILETNINGTLLTTRALLPLLIESGVGRIVNVSSGLGIFPGQSYIPYGVTKAAQIFFTRSLNTELDSTKFSKHKVKSVSILPHNFIKQTNIGNNFLNKYVLDWSNNEDMSSKEKKLYKDDFENHKRRLLGLCDVTDQFNKLVKKKDPTKSRSRSSSSSFKDKMIDLMELMKGKNPLESVEELEFLENFELALRLPNPPEEIFAGDTIFNLFIGPIILTLPAPCLRLFGSMINESLYK